MIAALVDDFFQPLASHVQLEEKLSIMIRRGYIGRNLIDGSLNSHMQNGYERIMTGDLDVFRFHQVKSTASSLSLIGCSGSGKSTSLNRILSAYPPVIFHEVHNFTQVVYLKVDCPHDGSLKSLCINFFVTLVNTIGLPVVFVGTPKARPIFEQDLRSGRQSAGFGSLLWEPMKPPALFFKHGRGSSFDDLW